MKNLFERTSSNWVRYSEYEWRAAEGGTLYLTPTKTAQPSIYDPLAEYQKIVLDAINIGLSLIHISCSPVRTPLLLQAQEQIL